MKRRRIVAVLLFCCITASLASSQGFMDKFKFQFETLPDPDGGGMKGSAGFDFSDNFASKLYIKQVVSSETGTLDLDFSGISAVAKVGDTLNLARESETEYLIIPAEFTFGRIGTEGLSVGLGGYLSVMQSDNVGYFQLDVTGGGTYSMNSYKYTSSGTFFGPVFTSDAYFDLGFLSLMPRVVVVPYIFFKQSVANSIYPALRNWGEGSESYSSTGFPYLAVSLEKIAVPIGKYFGLGGLRVGGELSCEYTSQNVKLLNKKMDVALANPYVWYLEDKKASLTTLQFIGRLGYSFPNGSSIDLGVGQRHTWNSLEGGPTATSNKVVYSVVYELHR